MINNKIKLISESEKNILYDKITELINKTFGKLNITDKNILIKYLFKTIMLFAFYFYNENFIDQLYLNKNQDIFSIMVLLMPFYDLNTSNTIITLDELFLNSNSKAKSLTSSYYVDHESFREEKNYLEKYFNSALLCVSETLYQTHCHILPNWCNIFPHTMTSYKKSLIFNNFIDIFQSKFFIFEPIPNIIWDITNETDNFEYKENIDKHFILGYSTLYSCVYNFFYMDIKPIKWMIYDINIDNKIIIPNIVYLSDKLNINSIANKPWDKLSEEEKKILEKNWIDIIKSPKTNKVSIKSLVLFYVRWEKDNNKLDELKIPNKCLKIIQTNIDWMNEEQNENDDENNNIDNYIYDKNNELEKCLVKIYPYIKYENIYKYIYDSIQRFRYTWYGYSCLDEHKNILNEENFFINYLTNNDVIIKNMNQKIDNNDAKKYYYLTPKNIYNYCKALIHITNNDNKYYPLSLNSKWTNVFYNNKFIFISRLNDLKGNWFNIMQNIIKSYGNNSNANEIMNEYRKKIIKSNLFPNIIFQTLVYNGMLNYYKFNPKMTDSSIIPNKNLKYDSWASYIMSNIDIKSYIESYHAFSNTKLSIHGDNVVKTISESRWYTNFGADWIAQIQLYHHCLHNRVMFITGATGAGKSTVSPFLLVYGVKILNFNNNAKVVCTQPRTQPVKDNSEQISKNIGLPIIIKKNRDLDDINQLYKNTSIGEGILQDINYIQYKHKNGNLTDDLYHPYLRVYTDGSLYNIIKQQYFFKKNSIISNEKNTWLSSNMFDIILVDEAHEHNIYMDMILTLSKYAIYINNQVSLGIISATMDNDEIIYRKYFQPIDENWKAPLNINNLMIDSKIQYREKFIPNINYIDRRIHLSIPFGGMNFDVKEYINDAGTVTDIKLINKKVIFILQKILNTSSKGDILIFQPGEADIKKLVKEINLITPPNVIAVPFYSKLDTDILENIVKKIHKEDVRKKIRYPKNKYDITEMYKKIPTNELLPENYYKRFIVIATNIAEASITIDSLEFVIDTGNQKLAVYDPETNQDNLEIRDIAIPNQKQRKGRVGRVKPGSVYYTYNIQNLDERVVYKINIQNINEFIINLITNLNTRDIDENSDPYKITSVEKLKSYLKNQYVYLNKFDTILFNNFYPKKNATNIIYPYSDGKYKLETLEDNDGLFYIIHPNEDYFKRDIELNILNKNVKPNYFNKISKTINFGKANGMIGNDNLLTQYGTLINNMVDFMEILETPIDFIKLILDCISFSISSDSDIFKNILMFIIFKISTYNFKISNNITGNADFLIYSGVIDDSLFSAIKYDDIFKLFDNELKNYDTVIQRKVNEIVNNKFYNKKSNYDIVSSDYGTILKNDKSIKNNIEEIKKVLISYYTLKFRIDIIISNTKFLNKNTLYKVIETLNNELSKNYSVNYKNIIYKIIIYYNQVDKYINKNILNNFIEELTNIPEDDLSKIHSNKIIKKITEIIKSNPIIDNESLVKIHLTSNIKYLNKTIEIFNNMSDYDKICFLIIKNIPQNILIKIPDTEFYIGYFNKDINKIYSLETNTIDNGKKKITFTSTKVSVDIRNYYIFGIDVDDQYDIKNLFSISEYTIKILNNYFSGNNLNLYKQNGTINEILFNNIYTNNKYNAIFKKIDKITKYVNKLDNN